MSSQEVSKSAVSPKSAATRSKWMYGSNALVLAVAALIVVILLDWITFRYNHSFDLTTGQIYSLSPQTRNLLNLLDKSGKKLIFVNTFPSSSQADAVELAQYARVQQLVHEYQRSSRNIREYQPTSRHALESLIQKRFGNSLKPYKKTLTAGVPVLTQLEKTFKSVANSLSSVPSNASITSDQQATIIGIAAYLSQDAPSDLRHLVRDIKSEAKAHLADWPGLAKTAQRRLKRMVKNLSIAIQPATIKSLPPAYQHWLKHESPVITKVMDRLKTVAATIAKLKPVKSASALAQIGPDRLLIIAPHSVKAVTASAMFQARGVSAASRHLRYAFNGEEAINGKLLSIIQPHKTKVVFVSAQPGNLTQRGGPFSAIARKLQRHNFDVLDWSPISSNPQAPGASGPPPAIGKGVVWVVLNLPPSGQMGMMEMQAAGRLDMELKKHLAQGGSAMFLLGAMPTQMLMATGGAPPFKTLLASYGIRYRPNLVIVSKQSDGQGHDVVGPQVRLSHFKKNIITGPMNSLTTMLIGLPSQGAGAVMGPTVVGLTPQAAKNIHRQIILRSPASLNVWAQSSDAPFKSHFIPAQDKRGPLPLGALAEKGNSRVVALGNLLFIYNGLLQSAQTIETGNTLENVLQFPGNSALFMNSIYWLSGQSKLIAASPRATVAMRIAPMSNAELNIVRIITFVGPALAAALIGIIVLIMRRRI